MADSPKRTWLASRTTPKACGDTARGYGCLSLPNPFLCSQASQKLRLVHELESAPLDLDPFFKVFKCRLETGNLKLPQGARPFLGELFAESLKPGNLGLKFGDIQPAKPLGLFYLRLPAAELDLFEMVNTGWRVFDLAYDLGDLWKPLEPVNAGVDGFFKLGLGIEAEAVVIDLGGGP